MPLPGRRPENDGDGAWEVLDLPNGVKERQLTVPSPAFIAVQNAIKAMLK